MADTHFAASGEVFFRFPILPVERSQEATLDLGTESAESGEELARYLLSITRDPVFREALEVSSSSLTQMITKVERGIPVPRRKLERAAVSVTRYLLRATMRPTPFGLMAGVALGSFGDRAAVDLEGEQVKRVTVDSGWAEKFVDGLLERPEIRHRVHLVSNNLRYERGDRQVLPLVRFAKRPEQHKSEVTVRNTPVISFVLESARRPVRYADLLRDTLAEFPVLDGDRLDGFLFSLLQQGFLLSDIAPRSDVSDPLGPARAFMTRESLVEEVSAVDEALMEYQSKPIGDGTDSWQSAMGLMKGLAPDVQHPAQVDVKVVGEFSLPHVVREEIEKAASLLWEMSDTDARYPHLAEYHAAFLEEYGTHQLVPVADLLNPHSGLDAPAGYLNPPSSRHLSDASAQQTPDGARELTPQQEERLAELVEQALLLQQKEISLSEADVGRLAHTSVRSPSGSVDMCLQLLARAPENIDVGDFTVVVSPFAQGRSAGSMLGRFVDVVDARDGMRRMLSADAGDGTLVAQVNFKPRDHRSLNVSAVPQLTDFAIPVGEFPGEGDVIDLDDLAVGATADRMYLVRMSDGREVHPVVPHVLNLHGQAPNIARFLSEILYSGENRWRSWGWGKKLRSLPFLPRVRYGRTILSLARWRPGSELSEQQEWSKWRAALDVWCRAWNVPDRVQLAAGDHRVELDLRREWHCRLLRDQIQRNPSCLIFESPMADRSALGWSNGYASEIVVALQGKGSWRTSGLPTAKNLCTALSAPPQYAPGSEWLYAKFYMLEEMEERFLSRHLPDLLASLPDCVDRWFFIRYRDRLPHLRLRFHGKDTRRLWGELLPALEQWISSPRNKNLVHDLVVGTYVPELNRYGGPKALAFAEHVFQKDSEYCLGQLQLRAAGGDAVPLEVLAARGYVGILSSFGERDWKEWVVRTLPRASKRIPLEVGQYRDFVLGSTPAEGGTTILDMDRLSPLTSSREKVVLRYAEVLTSLGADAETITSKVLALLHMHANRLMGIDREAEDRSYSLLRAVVLSESARQE